MKELLPCPFCGGTDFLYGNNTKMKIYWLKCKKCGVQTPSFHMEAMVHTFWSTRWEKLCSEE